MTKPDEFEEVSGEIKGLLHGRDIGLVLEILGHFATLAFRRLPDDQRAIVLTMWTRKLAETLQDAPKPRLH